MGLCLVSICLLSLCLGVMVLFSLFFSVFAFCLLFGGSGEKETL